MKYVFSIGFAVAIFSAFTFASAQSLDCNLPENRDSCLAELAKIEAEIAGLKTQTGKLESEAASISRDKKLLEIEIQQAKLQIKARELSIAKLGKDITTKEKNINTLQGRIVRSREGLAEIIRASYELDNYTMVEALLAQQEMSAFFQDMDAYTSIQSRIKDEIGYINKDKQDEEKEKDSLGQKRNEEYDTKYQIEEKKKVVEKAEAEKQRLLNLKNKEKAEYNVVINEKQKKVNEIKNALFALRDSGSIKFEDAVKYAKAAGAATGVRPAFILGILKQETNIGSNLGSCYLSDADTGAGVGANSGKAVANVMKPSRDVQPFLRITKALGKDPYKTRVSCPLSIGYGGAMGPSQFIPSTWEMFAARVVSARGGGGTANPWNAQDAFTATALYVADLGASAQTASAERNAACRYYSGKACGSVSGNTSYGNSVMAHALKLQADIDLITN
ncbi:MAG: hypothetical protein RJB39_26 [Candidatus Parcubacteria bacterium]|jgi:hypothetical protein